MNDIKKQIIIEELMKALGYTIDKALKDHLENIGFVLITFGFKTAGIGNYISNGKREDIIKALREAADKLEANEDLPPANTTIQ